MPIIFSLSKEEKGEANVLLAGRPFKLKKQLIEDLQNADLKNKISF